MSNFYDKRTIFSVHVWRQRSFRSDGDQRQFKNKLSLLNVEEATSIVLKSIASITAGCQPENNFNW